MLRREIGSRERAGFNLVEVLITLTIVALLTSTLITFVNDFDDKSKTVRARSDLMTMANAAQNYESKTGYPIASDVVAANSDQIPQALVDQLVEMPSHDPWGRRFTVTTSTVVASDDVGVAYVIDPSFGRIICAGPDGVVNTPLGRGASDTDNDLVVEFRQQPWLAFAMNQQIWIARADGTRLALVYSGVINVTFSPNGSRWAGVADSGGGPLMVGSTSAENPAASPAPNPPGAVSANNLSSVTYPFFFPDGTTVGWVNSDGSLRTYDFHSRSTRIVLPQDSLPIDEVWSPGDAQGRIVHVSVDRTYYWRKKASYGTSIAISVSGDGKIAYGAYTARYAGQKSKGIHVSLPGGDDRLLKKQADQAANLDEWLPLFWIDGSAVAYYADDGSGKMRLRRINQDGRYDIPLYDHTSGGMGPNPPIAPSINPEGSLMAILQESTSISGKVLRTDGAGWFRAGGPASAYSHGSAAGTYQEALWGLDSQRPPRPRLVLPSKDAVASTLLEVSLYPPGSESLPLVAGTIDQMGATAAIPGAMKLNSNQTLVAVISHPGMASAGKIDGVYVYPLLGPEGAKITITTTEPIDGPVAITWIND